MTISSTALRKTVQVSAMLAIAALALGCQPHSTAPPELPFVEERPELSNQLSPEETTDYLYYHHDGFGMDAHGGDAAEERASARQRGEQPNFRPPRSPRPPNAHRPPLPRFRSVRPVTRRR
jgi:hypothetical protein